MEFENKRSHAFDNLREFTLFDCTLGHARVVCHFVERLAFRKEDPAECLLFPYYSYEAYYRGEFVCGGVYFGSSRLLSEEYLDTFAEVGFRPYGSDTEHAQTVLAGVLQELRNNPDWGGRVMEIEAALELDVADAEEEQIRRTIAEL